MTNLRKKAVTKVKALYRYGSFEDLFYDFPPEYFGGKSKDELIKEIETFYSKEEQKKYGVVGIKIETLTVKNTQLILANSVLNKLTYYLAILANSNTTTPSFSFFLGYICLNKDNTSSFDLESGAILFPWLYVKHFFKCFIPSNTF